MDPRDTAVLLPQPSGDQGGNGSFDCAEESAHYAFSVQLLLTQYAALVPWQTEGVAELGSGDARAIAHVVRAVPGLTVHGTDISAASVARARQTIDHLGVADRYTVELGDFFAWADSPAGARISTVIANPPYIPAPDGDIRMPELWGGVRGNDLVLRLLKAGYDNVITAVASYSDPETTVRTAGDRLGDGDPWAAALPAPQQLPPDLVAEGHTVPIARVQAMHEGKRRARARRADDA